MGEPVKMVVVDVENPVVGRCGDAQEDGDGLQLNDIYSGGRSSSGGSGGGSEGSRDGSDASASDDSTDVDSEVADDMTAFEPRLSEHEMAIRKKLYLGKTRDLPGSNGSFCSDYKVWVKNKHPLGSIIFAHPLHPYTRMHRVIVQFNLTAWAFCVCVLLEVWRSECYEWDDDSDWRRGLTEMVPRQAQRFLSSEDVRCDSFYAADSFAGSYLSSVLVALLVMPYEAIMVSIATCGCCRLKRKKSILRSCGLCFSSGVIGILFITGLIEFAFGLFLLTYQPKELNGMSMASDHRATFVTFGLAKFQSVFFWFLWMTPVFIIKRRYLHTDAKSSTDSKRPKNKRAKKFAAALELGESVA